MDTSELMSDYLNLIGGNKINNVKSGLFLKPPNLKKDHKFQNVVKADLEDMVNNVDLDLHEPMWRILLVQSVLGHAQMGHGLFKTENVQYPHATIPDIIRAAGMKVSKTKEQRQKPINMFSEWVNKALDNKVTNFNLNGKPLMGVNFLRGSEYKVKNPENALKGAVIMGFVDSNSARDSTIHKYKRTISGGPLVIGGGETYLVNPTKLKQLGLNYNLLADHAHNDEAIEILQKMEVIVQNGKESESAYIRRRNGAGTSDDLAFIMIGKKYGIEAMIGAFLVDAIDTYDKCVTYPAQKGLDEQIASYIQNAWLAKTGQELISEDEIYQIIYASAKKNTPVVNVSSSHRKLVQFIGNDKHYKPTILSHISFVEGKPTEDFRVGFKGGLRSKTFYKRAKKRIEKIL